MNGYLEKILHVNLSTGKLRDEALNQDWAEQFIGNSGLGARYLFDMVDAATDPLGPDNPLIMMTGPLTGTRTPSASRHAFISKSPLTGLFGESSAGGYTGHELKRAGYDGIIITGQSPTPVYLLIREGLPPKLRPAEHLWGLDTYQTQNEIIAESGDSRTRVACIGPAGENLVRFASIMNADARAAGRAGMGAVMGSKKLKAIAIRGKGLIPVSDKEAVNLAFRKAMAHIKADFAADLLKDLGTASGLEYFQMVGSLPAKYWTEGDYEGALNLSGAAMSMSIRTGSTGCWGCTVQCGSEVTIEGEDDPYALGTTDGPEYEAVASLGSNLLIEDLKAVSYFDWICDSAGMDVISAGAVIGFAAWLSEQGYLSSADSKGETVEWGNPAQTIELLKKIAVRDGFGDILADGVRAMEEHFNAPGLAVQVNGMDPGMHDPRAFSGMALVYLTSPRGACHNKSDFYFVETGHTFDQLGIASDDHHQEAGKAPLVAKHQDYRSMVDACGCCVFVNVNLQVLPETFQAILGKEISLDELVLGGERIFNLKRLLNLKLGLKPRQDEVMPILLNTPLASGPTDGFVPDWQLMLKEYYAHRDWDWESGRPSAQKLTELGLDELVI